MSHAQICSLGRDESFEEKFAVLAKSVETSHLLVELRVYDQVEVIVYLPQLSYVFILHLSASSALSAGIL